MTYQLSNAVEMEKQLELFSIESKINDIGSLQFLKTANHWFNGLLDICQKFDNENYIKIIQFQNKLNDIVYPWANLCTQDHTIDIDISKYTENQQLIKNVDDAIEKFTQGITESEVMQQRRFQNAVVSSIVNYFWDTQYNAVNTYLLELQAYINELLPHYQQLKQQETQKILKDRSQFWATELLQKDDEEYLKYVSDYAQYRSNKFIIKEFLGLVGQYINWKFPIAYIDPNIGELTRHILSGDPFYVIDDRELPYKNLLETLPIASQKKIHHYSKKTAMSHLEEASVGMCVSWNNYPFMTQGKISNDIKMISKILRPGGLFVFNYADAHSVSGAKFIENNNNVPVLWKERLDRFASENKLIEIASHEFERYPFKAAVYRKEGKMPDLNITNKLGLVLPNRAYLKKRKLDETAEAEKAKEKSRHGKLQRELKRLQERDRLMSELAKSSQLGKENILELKLKKAINNLNTMIVEHNSDYTHPSVLESLLYVSKITYHLGRVKDSKNLIKRVERDVAKMSGKNLVARKFREWKNFLNNIDT